MNIAFIVGKFPSVSETFILNQITGLIDRGHQVDIYAEKPESLTTVHQEIDTYQLLRNTYYFTTVPKNHLKRLLMVIYLILKNFFRNPLITIRSLDIVRYGREAKSLRLIFATTPFISKQPKYDVIQCHFGTSGVKGIILRDMGAIKGKIVTTFHGSDVSKTFHEFNNNYYAELFSKGDYFLPISQFWQNKLFKLGCPSYRTSVHHMGVDPKQLEFRAREPSNDQKIRLVSIARLVEKKGIEYGIKAIAKLSAKYPQIEYVVVGDGDLRRKLEFLIEELRVGQQVKLLGWQEKSAIKEILNYSDILLAPSVTAKNGDQEGIPVVLMEAMSIGLPVISTLHSGIPELVQDGSTGFLVPEKDVDAICNKIDYFINHPEFIYSMGKKGSEYIEQNYNIHLLNKQLDETFHQVSSQ